MINDNFKIIINELKVKKKKTCHGIFNIFNVFLSWFSIKKN